MNFQFIKIVVATLFSLAASTASATLMTDLSERDWQVNSGDRALTYDASTGLEWLDLTVTAGNSLLETEAQDFFVSGGFRWATLAEIVGLQSAIGALFSTDPGAISNAKKFISFLGNTVDTTSSNPSHQHAYGFSRGHEVLPGSTLGTYYGNAVIVESYENYEQLVVLTETTEFYIDENYKAQFVGHWLVRDTFAVNVQEPAGLYLLSLALGGFVLLRRKSLLSFSK